MTDFIKFLKSRIFWKHFAFAFVGIIVGINLILLGIKIFTHHGQALSVPVFSGLSLDEAMRVAEDKDLRLQVIDSVFIQGKPGGTIVAQNPSPSSKVKAKRIIFITLNAVSPEKVEMPNVMGLSLRQAEAIIETRGLKLGITSYVPDIAVNYVLRQLYRKREISPNTRINKGSRIDLVVGMGLSNEKAALPNLVGLSIDKARENLTQSILNFGAIVYDNSVETFEDSANAVIWRQKPEFNPGNTINLGSSIDVYLTVDQAKVNKSDSTSTVN